MKQENAMTQTRPRKKLLSTPVEVVANSLCGNYSRIFENEKEEKRFYALIAIGNKQK